MKLIFKQKIIAWFDSYNVYDENDRIVFTIKGQLSLGHCFKVYDAGGYEVATIKEKIISLLPQFYIYKKGEYAGVIKKEFTLLRPKFDINFNNWHIEGGYLEWNYQVYDEGGNQIAVMQKKLISFSDTYIIDVNNPDDALDALCLAAVIDAEKCSRNK